MDLLGSSLDDLIKKDKKTGRKGGIHNKMRRSADVDMNNKQNRPAGIRGGRRGTGMRGSGTPRPTRGGAKVVQKVNRAPNRIQKDRGDKPAGRGGKTLIVNSNSRNNRRNGLKAAAANARVKQTRTTVAGDPVAAKRQEILQLKRQLRRALQRKEALNGGVAQQQQKPNPQNPKQAQKQQPNNARRQPQAPVKAASTQKAQQQRGQFQASREPLGPIELRKLKVHNIDKNTVSVQDLKTLFGKCGPLFNCNYDFDEFGQYLGTVTIVYLNEAHAFRAIANYNRAAIDNKVMRVEYASSAEKGARSSSKGRDAPVPRFKQQGPKKHAQKTIRKR